MSNGCKRLANNEWVGKCSKHFSICIRLLYRKLFVSRTRRTILFPLSVPLIPFTSLSLTRSFDANALHVKIAWTKRKIQTNHLKWNIVKKRRAHRIHLNVSFVEYRKYFGQSDCSATAAFKSNIWANVVKWRLKCTLGATACECENCKYACAHALEMCYNFNLNLCIHSHCIYVY